MSSMLLNTQRVEPATKNVLPPRSALRRGFEHYGIGAGVLRRERRAQRRIARADYDDFCLFDVLQFQDLPPVAG